MLHLRTPAFRPIASQTWKNRTSPSAGLSPGTSLSAPNQMKMIPSATRGTGTPAPVIQWVIRRSAASKRRRKLAVPAGSTKGDCPKPGSIRGRPSGPGAVQAD